MSKKKTALGSKPTRERPDVQQLARGLAGGTARLNANVPAELYARYKSAVKAHGLTVTSAIVQHMHRFLEDHE